MKAKPGHLTSGGPVMVGGGRERSGGYRGAKAAKAKYDESRRHPVVLDWKVKK